MDQLRYLFPTATPCILTYEEAERALVFAPASLEFYRIDNPEWSGLTRVSIDGLSIASLVARRTLASKRVEYVNVGDVEADPSYLKLIQNTRSELCVAAMSGERLLGVIALESTEPHTFNDDDVNLVRSVAHQVGIAIDRARQNAQLRFKTTVSATTAWAADIAHDINREVGYIRNRAYCLSQEPGLSPEGRRYTQEIDDSADRLAGTLASAKPGQTSEYESLDLDNLLRQWVAELTESRGSAVNVRFDLGCEGQRVYTNRVALKRVVRHLVRNALEAMAGSGVINVRTRPTSERSIEVQIEDTGPGVPDHLRQIIFQEPLLTKGEGRGFGLLFVRSTVEDMGGVIRLLPPEDGKGAVFAFTIPSVNPTVGGA